MTVREQNIVNWIKKYFIKNGPDANAVIGISGGKDSTVAAALVTAAIGPEKVITVKMPQDVQEDIETANEVIDFLKIPKKNIFEVNIESACHALYSALPLDIVSNPIVYTNLPARIRMATLYAIAGGNHGRVVNTCNYSEDYVGYSTKYGDNAGDFSVLSTYTVREVINIGKQLNIPEHLLYKTPTDGLCGLSDEENLGFTYETLDDYLLDKKVPDYDTLKKIEELHSRNLHKKKSMPTCPRWGEDGTPIFFF